jgi:hypothetical protein
MRSTRCSPGLLSRPRSSRLRGTPEGP